MRPRRDPHQLYWHDYVMKACILPLVPRRVTPNHVTVLRFLLTPFAVWGLAIHAWSWAIPLFLFTAFTDVIDGSLARVRRQVTEWGAMYDPLADKLLISLTAVVVVTATVGWWLTILLIFFEFAIVMGALRYRNEGGVVMANTWGKTKMFLQSSGVLCLLLSMSAGVPVLVVVGMWLLVVSIFFAIVSLVTYGL